jgi:23S rRNA (cytidine1920-2'-O)/16S rRNA (cytidine1409-2'-O)-methyltransferase
VISVSKKKVKLPGNSERLDRLLLERGLADSRQRAQALIQAGRVLVDEQTVSKAGARVSLQAAIRLRVPDHPYVSRGGLKLEAALDAFELQVDGLSALDVGASTGGFCDCLLQRGARHVVAVDVGYGQLAWSLRQDPRVTCIERTNARHLEPDQVREALTDPGAWPLELGTIDVSFISLTLVLPAVARVLGPDRPLLALVKPQFEASRADVGKGGVVRDPDARQRAIQRVAGWAGDSGFAVGPGLDSPVAGPKGNVEHLLLLRTPNPGGAAPPGPWPR